MLKAKYLLCLILTLFPCIAPAKQDANNAAEARKLFTKVYNMVYGQEGSSLSYSVNIVGLYKTEGDIIIKGKKLCYKEKKYASWQDGVTAYMVNKKKKTVNIYSANDDSRDTYFSKFKFNANDYDFSYKVSGDNYAVTAKVRNSSTFGIKRVTIVINRKTLYPQSLNIKLAFLSTTVKISNFKAGGISDSVFKFPKSSFNGYEFTDHRQ